MSRFFACLILLLAAAPLAAQPRPGEPIRLTLSPGALPAPSLKYPLLPDPQDQIPGNAASLYYRAEAMLAGDPALLKRAGAELLDDWRNAPLKDLPLDNVRDALRPFGPVLSEIKQAVRRRECDWQLEGRSEGAALVIPDVQGMRLFARIVALQARYEIAQGHFDAALQSLQIGYSLARHLGAGPTLIHVLVGVAIAGVINGQLEELVQQPGAPDLYWSLALMPRPYFDPGLSLNEEGTQWERMFPGLKRLEEGPMSAAEVAKLQKAIRKFHEQFRAAGPGALEVGAQVIFQGAAYPDAKRVLLAQGMPAEQVEAMPPFQVVALWALRDWHGAWDEFVKWVHVPSFGSRPEYQRARQRVEEATRQLYRLVFYGGKLLEALEVGSPPAIDRVYLSMWRIERRFAALGCVEALRLHAASHGGKLPATLTDITEVPVPPDPVTGKPFEYRLTLDKAILTAPHVPGSNMPENLLLTYELTMRP
jgi:hypothetical protein